MLIFKVKSEKNVEKKKIDVKKLQSRRKELFRKRVRVTRPTKVFSSTNSPPAVTTTRSRGFPVRSKPQAVKGVFVNRRPSQLPNKLQGTNANSGVSSTINIEQLRKKLQQQQAKLQSLQETPNQKDEGGGRNVSIKRKELPNDSKSENIRCRFFKNSC